MPQIFNNAVMTDSGRTLLNNAIAGVCEIQITRMAIGSGEYTADEKSTKLLQRMAALKKEEQSVVVSSLRFQDETTVLATAVFTNDCNAEAYHINEIGLFAKEKGVEGSEILYSIAVIDADEGETMPVRNGKNTTKIIQSWAISVSNVSEVTLNLPPDSVFALAADIGQLNLLCTDAKSDLVSAINEIINSMEELTYEETMDLLNETDEYEEEETV